MRLDRANPACDGTPVRTQIEAVIRNRLKSFFISHPLWLRERAPDLFRRMGELALDHHRERFRRRIRHCRVKAHLPVARNPHGEHKGLRSLELHHD